MSNWNRRREDAGKREDYEDDFTEESTSESVDTIEDSSTSSWGHPPLPLHSKSAKPHTLVDSSKANISQLATTLKETQGSVPSEKTLEEMNLSKNKPSSGLSTGSSESSSIKTNTGLARSSKEEEAGSSRGDGPKTSANLRNYLGESTFSSTTKLTNESNARKGEVSIPSDCKPSDPDDADDFSIGEFCSSESSSVGTASM